MFRNHFIPGPMKALNSKEEARIEPFPNREDWLLKIANVRSHGSCFSIWRHCGVCFLEQCFLVGQAGNVTYLTEARFDSADDPTLFSGRGASTRITVLYPRLC